MIVRVKTCHAGTGVFNQYHTVKARAALGLIYLASTVVKWYDFQFVFIN